MASDENGIGGRLTNLFHELEVPIFWAKWSRPQPSGDIEPNSTIIQHLPVDLADRGVAGRGFIMSCFILLFLSFFCRTGLDSPAPLEFGFFRLAIQGRPSS